MGSLFSPKSPPPAIMPPAPPTQSGTVDTATRDSAVENAKYRGRSDTTTSASDVLLNTSPDLKTNTDDPYSAKKKLLGA